MMNHNVFPFAERKVARAAGLFSVAVIALMAGTSSAFSAKLTVTDGTTITQNGGTYTSEANDFVGAAVYASGAGSVINGSGLIIEGAGYSQGPVYADNGGTINLTGNTVISGGRDGLYARGRGDQTATGSLANAIISTITMNGGSISATTGTGVYVSQGGFVDLTNVSITASGQGISVTYGGNLTMKGGSITTTGSQAALSVSSHQYYTQNGQKYFNYANATVDGITINSVGTGIFTQQIVLSNTPNLTVTNFSVTTSGSLSYGLNANEYSNTYLENGVIRTSGQEAEGIWAVSSYDGRRQTKVEGKNITIATTGLNAHGVHSMGAIVDLTNSHITVARAFGLFVESGGLINFTGNSAITVQGQGGTAVLVYGSGSQANIGGSTITTEANGTVGFQVYSSLLNVKNSNVTVGGDGSYGMYVTSGATANFENTAISVTGEGSANTFGIVFLGATALNTVSLTGSSLSAPKTAAVIAQGGTDVLSLTNSSLSGDTFLVAQRYVNGANSYGAKVSVNADHSQIQGGASVDLYSTTNVSLNNGSVWTVTPSTLLDTPESHVSVLNVNDSAIEFSAPVGDAYQTLTVGSGVPGTTAVYNATGNARLAFNTFFNEGGALSKQHTDRLLINGDVAGTTQITVRGAANSPGGYTSSAGNNLAAEGISLIQVSGTASESSFSLLGGYTTLARMPYQYSLYAYGPGSSHGEADESQRLVAGTDPHWDYRLQSVYRELPPEPKPEPGPNPGPKPKPVREVVPQVSNYLIAPVALFQAGQMDISNLHSRLGEIRDDRAMGRNKGKGEFFMRAYGGMYDYTSNRNAYSYGYNADIDYAAVQLGGNLYAFEGKTGITRFGLAGSIGSLSFDPKNVKNTNSTTLNTWSVSAYGTYLNDNGWYVDGVVSYGQFDGNVSQNIRGKAADLKGHSFSVSVETGYPFKFANGLVLEPQAQLLYQRLMFDRTEDIADHFTVALGTQDQLLARLGARLSKSFEQPQKDKLVTVYAKANVLHTFGDGGKVFLGDTFRLGRIGTALEAGLGVNATLAKNLSLYADAAYQHRVGGHGISGVSLTAGMRYDF